MTDGYAENLKVALYAATGGRKTLQIAKLIQRVGAENVGIISCEGGLSTIASLVVPEQVERVNSIDELAAAASKMRKTYGRPDQWICVDGGSRVLQWFQERIWGSVDTVYRKLLEGTKPSELDETLRPYAIFVTKGGEVNTQGMWVRLGSDCTRLFNSFVRQPASIYWTFWEELTNTDQYTKGFPWKPDTPGKGALDAIKGSFDFIGRLTPGEGSATAHFNDASKVYYAKRRDDWNAGIRVPDEIRSFDLGDFVERLRGTGWPNS